METSDESRTRRDGQRRKYSKMDKMAKDKLVRSPPPFASFPFTSLPVRHRVPSHFNCSLHTCNVTAYRNAVTLQVTHTIRSSERNFHPVPHRVTVSCERYTAGFPSLLREPSDVFAVSSGFVFFYIYIYSGPGSSVRITTAYGLDSPGSNPGGDEIFRPSRPALGSTQPPVKWVSGFSRG